MKNDLVRIISDAVKMLGCETIPPMELEVPPNDAFGDMATPVAMSLSKVLRKPPRKIAEAIVNSLQAESIFERIDIAGPGFINFFFSKEYLHSGIRKLLQYKSGFLREDMGKGRRVQIEFVSANPTGPLHLGHGRGAAIGEALSNLLHAAGFHVEREYYINDAGRQVKLLGLSVFARYQQLLGVEYPFPEDGYKGAYVEEIAARILLEKDKEYVQKTFDDVSRVFIDYSYRSILSDIREDLRKFGVAFDTWQSERELFDGGEVRKANVARDRRALRRTDCQGPRRRCGVPLTHVYHSPIFDDGGTRWAGTSLKNS